MKKQIFAVLMIMSLLVLGPSAWAAPVMQDAGGAAYVVQANDWLSKIAEKYYGDIFAYPAIVEATNAKAAEDDSFAVIDNPDLIEVGQKLWIPAQPTAGLMSIDALKNATYSGIYDEPVQLTGGLYEGQPFVEGGASRPTVTFVDGFYAFGDVTGDGVADAAVFLAENSGGSGVFTYLAVVSMQDDRPVNLGTAWLGDRGELVSVTIADGQIAVDMVTQGPDDAMCCATLEVVQTFALQNGELTLVSTDEIGTISTAALDGTAWTLVSYGEYGQPSSVLPNTSITITFDAAESRIAGLAGCNNYFASFTEEAGRALSLGPVGSTMMACPEEIMSQELAFLTALQGTRTFRFFNGGLMLMGDGGLLTFVPAE